MVTHPSHVHGKLPKKPLALIKRIVSENSLHHGNKKAPFGAFSYLAEREGFEPSLFSIFSIPCKGVVSKSGLMTPSRRHHLSYEKTPGEFSPDPEALTFPTSVDALLRNAQHATLNQ